MKSVLVYLAKKIAVGTRKDHRTNKTQIKSKQKKTKLKPEQPVQKIAHSAL